MSRGMAGRSKTEALPLGRLLDNLFSLSSFISSSQIFLLPALRTESWRKPHPTLLPQDTCPDQHGH